MAAAHLLLVGLSGCVMFDTTPAELRLRELTDDDRDGSTLAEGDCDDHDPRVRPGVVEVCDGVDNDCDEQVDEEPPASPYCIDADGDGHGAVGSETWSCAEPSNAVASCDDCDDTAPAVHPGATELCNGVDDNCDTQTDGPDAADPSTWYRDGDQDGYGDASVSDRRCEALPGYVADDTDCDDLRGEVHPGAEEVCDNGLDDNCDGSGEPCGWQGSEWLDPRAASAATGGYVPGEGEAQSYGVRLQVLEWVEGAEPALLAAGFMDPALGELNYAGIVDIWLSPPRGVVSQEGASLRIHGVPDLLLGWGGGPYEVADVDGDGARELLLPAQYGGIEGFYPGGQVIRVPLGITGDYQVSAADALVWSERDNDGFGSSAYVSPGLLTSGEALVVGAPGDGTYGRDAGSVQIGMAGQRGAFESSASVYSLDHYDELGWDLVPRHDADGDGLDDLIGSASARGDSGAAFLFKAPLDGVYMLDDADALLNSRVRMDIAQNKLMSLDYDDDGTADLVVGAEAAMGAGIYFVSGEPRGDVDLEDIASVILEAGESGTDYDTRFVAGDFNGDHQADLAYSVYNYSTSTSTFDQGRVYVTYGPLGELGSGGFEDTAQASFTGQLADALVGRAVAAGDITGDGRDDLFTMAEDPAAEDVYHEGGVYWLEGEGW